MLYAYFVYNNDYIFYVEIKPLHNIVNTLLMNIIKYICRGGKG